MISKSIKKIWIFCLCLAGLSLAWCFHVPDEDWLLSNNEVETWNVEKVDELEQAVNSLKEWIDIISQQRNDMKNENESTDKENNKSNLNQLSIQEQSTKTSIKS